MGYPLYSLYMNNYCYRETVFYAIGLMQNLSEIDRIEGRLM